MKHLITALLIGLGTPGAFGQRGSDASRAVVAEGKKLYRLEMASWYGTDMFVARTPARRAASGGYFSYQDNDRVKCVFFTKDEVPKTLAVISFDSTYQAATARFDSTARPLDARETALFKMRKRALEMVETDTLFKIYQNANLNLIPLIEGKEKKVYIITGPQVPNVVLFGNDYLLTFGSANELRTKQRLHRNLIPIRYGKDGQPQKAAMHAHLAPTNELITPTDICTIMLYGRFAGWEQYYVMSKDFISIWDCRKNSLLVLTRKAWDRINADSQKRQPAAKKP